MNLLSQENQHLYSTGFPWEIVLFCLTLLAYLAFLIWATNPRWDDEIDRAIARGVRGEVDPDDISAALDFPRKQARTSKALRGGDE